MNGEVVMREGIWKKELAFIFLTSKRRRRRKGRREGKYS